MELYKLERKCNDALSNKITYATLYDHIGPLEILKLIEVIKKQEEALGKHTKCRCDARFSGVREMNNAYCGYCGGLLSVDGCMHHNNPNKEFTAVVDIQNYSIMVKNDFASGFSWHLFKFGEGNKTHYKRINELERQRIDALFKEIYGDAQAKR